jgi:hypothetical protein
VTSDAQPVSAYAAIEGTQKLPPAASGAFLPQRPLDPEFQGATYPFLDNPGRVPGAQRVCATALVALSSQHSRVDIQD